MDRNIGFYWLNFFHTIFNSLKGQKALTSWLVMSFLTIVTLFLLPLFLFSPLNAPMPTSFYKSKDWFLHTLLCLFVGEVKMANLGEKPSISSNYYTRMT